MGQTNPQSELLLHASCIQLTSFTALLKGLDIVDGSASRSRLGTPQRHQPSASRRVAHHHQHLILLYTAPAPCPQQ